MSDTGLQEQTIVISDLLSFLSCKLNLTTKEKLLRTLRQYYSEKEICEAHQTLLASLPEKKSTRHGRRVKHPDPLIAIYDCFQLISENDLPIFVCKNLNNVPELDTAIKLEPQDDDDEEQDADTDVEKSLREEQKVMRSQIADIAFVVKQLKDQLQSITQQASATKSSPQKSDIKKRKENLTEFKPQKKKTSELHNLNKPKTNQNVKKKGLAYLQSLIDEDEDRSDREQSEKDNNSDFQDELDSSDIEYEELEDPQESESISCEVVLKEEAEDLDSRFCKKKGNLPQREIGSPSKDAVQKVIYIKNNERDDLKTTDDENSIEIASTADYIGNLEDTDSSSRMPYELSYSEEDFKGEIEIRVEEDQFDTLDNLESKLCSICGESFSTQKKLDLHVRSHCVKKIFDCVLCDEGFLSKELLRSHFEQCLEATKRKYNLDAFPCPTCGRLYAKEKALKQHLSMHSESRPFGCNQCTYRYLTKSSLEAHIKTQHNIMNKFFCPFCDNSYISSGFLKNHIRSHTGERPYACSDCGYRASTPDLLKRHMLTHGPPKEYKCDICKVICLGIGKLSRHKAKEHKKENIFCTICGKEFNNSCVYQKHYMSHVGARPFPCTVCAYAAISKEVLMVHMRTHTGDNLINCPNCSIPFGTKYSLKRHLKSYCVDRPRYFSSEFTIEAI